jgi:hypothetical protein
LQAKIEQTIPFLTVSNGDLSKPNLIESNTNNKSNNATSIDPWTVLEDYEAASLLRFFNCKRRKRDPLTYSETLFTTMTAAATTTTKTKTTTAIQINHLNEGEKQQRKRPLEQNETNSTNTANSNNSRSGGIGSGTSELEMRPIPPPTKKAKLNTQNSFDSDLISSK